MCVCFQFWSRLKTGKTLTGSADIKNFYLGGWGGLKERLRPYILQIKILFYSSCRFEAINYKAFESKEASKFKRIGVL